MSSAAPTGLHCSAQESPTSGLAEHEDLALVPRKGALSRRALRKSLNDLEQIPLGVFEVCPVLARIRRAAFDVGQSLDPARE
jgi:hypothetical protein